MCLYLESSREKLTHTGTGARAARLDDISV